MKRILHVEDDELIAMMTAEILQGNGYEVESTSNPDTAIQLLESGEQFDIIITDFNCRSNNFAGAGGEKVAEVVRRKLPNASLILMSGNADQEKIKQLCQPDFQIAKPPSFDELVETVRACGRSALAA